MLERTIGVWWDINTCPVPDGIELASVRSRIERSLTKPFGVHQFPIFCVGDLERTPPRVLRELSSSGILLRHVPPFGWATLGDHVREWRKRYPITRHIMLISGDISWFTGSWFHSIILSLGFDILRAFPSPRPPGYPCLQEWVWEPLLLEANFLTNNKIPPKDEHVSFCTLCQFPSQSCDDFIHHLNTSEHRLEFADSVLAFVDENNDVLSHSKLFDYPGFDLTHMTIPWTGEQLSQNMSCLSVRAFNERSFIPRRGFTNTIGVWWDINSCPVPDGYDPGRVRSCIESALHEYLGHACPVTIFCVGNLEFISPQVLKAISSSGILLRHDMDRGLGLLRLLSEWEKRNPPPAKIMLISGDGAWHLFSIYSSGYTLLRALPLNSDSFSTCTFTHSWAWESLLQNKSLDANSPTHSPSLLEDANSPKDQVHDSWFCTICKIPSQSCDDFINHLKGTSHLDKLWSVLLVDENLKPCFYCESCEYPGINEYNYEIHMASEEHAQKVKRRDLVATPVKKRRVNGSCMK